MPFRLSIALVPGRVGQYLILVGSWNISDLTTRHETASLAGPSQVAFSVHSDRSKPDPDMKMIAEVARLDIEHSAASFALWPLDRFDRLEAPAGQNGDRSCTDEILWSIRDLMTTGPGN